MTFFKDLEQTSLLTGDENTDLESVDRAFEDILEEEEQVQQRTETEYRTLSAVEARLEKANLYRAVLENPLFPDEGSSISAEVEQEYREFTLRRLNVLLGIEDSGTPETELEFEEKKILKVWARKLLGKPSVLGLPAQVQEPRLQSTVTPVTVKVQPRPQIQVQSPKPTPQTPQRQRVQTKPVPVNKSPVRVTEDEHGNEFVFKGGKKYLKRDGKDALTGKPKTVLVDVTAPAKPTNVSPTPYPSQQAAMMHEVTMADLTMPKNGPLGDALQKVTTRTSSGG